MSIDLKKELKYIRNDEGNFTCPHCDKVTTRQNTMFYHLKKHAGILNYKCTEPGCDRAFIQKSGLQQHLAQAHPPSQVPNLYACTEAGCDHSSRMKANLIIHIGRKHGAGWIPAIGEDGACSGCDKQFSSPTAYYYHAVQCFRTQVPDTFAEKLTAIVASV